MIWIKRGRRRFAWLALAAVGVLFCLAMGPQAGAQTAYNVTDLGVLTAVPGVPPPLPLSSGGFIISCAMGLNEHGWAESMDGFVNESGNFVGRATLRVNGSPIPVDLGTLGGRNSWINWGGINDSGQAVGLAETPVPDPDGEDFCGFGTGLTCRPFLWQNGHMSALPTLDGNNGQASAINNLGQIVGQAQTTVTDTACPPYQTALPVLWEKGNIQQLPTVHADPHGYALGINDRGQVVGGTGTCSGDNHAVLWENGAAIELPNLGNSSYNEALAINDQGQIAGLVSSVDGSTFYAALWQNGTVTNLQTLPGDFAALATGINDKGQVVGSTLDFSFNWSRGFIWQDGVMTDLNALFPADSNLYATMANKINSRGEISGMATVVSGPHAGEIHAFLAVPVNASTVALGVRRPAKVTLPESVLRRRLLRR